MIFIVRALKGFFPFWKNKKEKDERKEELYFLKNQLKILENNNDLTESVRINIKSCIKELEFNRITFFVRSELIENLIKLCGLQNVTENKKLLEEIKETKPILKELPGRIKEHVTETTLEELLEEIEVIEEECCEEERLVIHITANDYLEYEVVDLEPEWYIGMSNKFIKSMRSIDRKMQGRILEALKMLSADPKTPKGDTIKALTGDLNGLWRYRIRDFRLIYHADSIKKRILLLSFEARGKVYN